MSKREKRLISIDSALAKFIDEDLKETGKGSNFSGWISDMSTKALKISYGFRYNSIMKRIKDEMAQHD